MNAIQLPPSGVSENFGALIPVGPLGSSSAIVMEGVWEKTPLGLSEFDPSLMEANGFEAEILWLDVTDYNTAASSFVRILSFPPKEGDLRLDVTVALGGSAPQPGCSLTLTAKSAQVPSGSAALTLDTWGEEVSYGEPVEIARIEVLSWEDWYILNGRDGSGSGS